MFRNYCLKLTYLGDDFAGWQVQPGFRTAQGEIESLLSKIFKDSAPVKIKYPSRTDSGVHAIEQVVSFAVDSNYTEYQLFRMLNTQLPRDIKIKELNIVSDDFNAKYPLKKTYLYRILTTKYNDPLRYQKVWWYPQDFDLKKLQDIAREFVGKKDFKGFMGAGSSVKTTFRNVLSLEVQKQDDEVHIYITANGFLKNMVRNIVGTMMDYARGLLSLEDIRKIFKENDRALAGVCAPPYGLYLYKLYYDKSLNVKKNKKN